MSHLDIWFLTAIIGEKTHQWTSCGTWLWALRDGMVKTAQVDDLNVRAANIVSKLVACH